MEEENDPKTVNEQGSTSVVGISWNYKTEEFQFMVQDRIQPEVITKRVIISAAVQIFDSHGYLKPIRIIAKLYI